MKVVRSQQRIGGRGSQAHGDVLQCHASPYSHAVLSGCESGPFFKLHTLPPHVP